MSFSTDWLRKDTHFFLGGVIIQTINSLQSKEKDTNKVDTEMSDELRPEYDLRSLRVRKPGPGRQSFGGSVVRLEPDTETIKHLPNPTSQET